MGNEIPKERFNTAITTLNEQSNKREEDLNRRIFFERGYREGLKASNDLFLQIIDLKPEKTKKVKS